LLGAAGKAHMLTYGARAPRSKLFDICDLPLPARAALTASDAMLFINPQSYICPPHLESSPGLATWGRAKY